jgi:hypothetical protein
MKVQMLQKPDLNVLNPEPVPGKTYSLFAEKKSTDIYFQEIKSLLDQWLSDHPASEELLTSIRKIKNPGKSTFGSRKWRQFEQKHKSHLHQLEETLAPYLLDVDGHLKSISWTKRFERTLRTSRWQYFFYMIEIELVNRLNVSEFKSAKNKLAFLPHCLHDLSKTCQAEPDDLDYKCRRCSKSCFIRQCSDMLEVYNIRPYIWMQVDLRRLLRHLNHQQQTTGVLGIACIPELVNGMRLCAKYQTPVIGIPLNANRCRRWMGSFYDNSVNLKALKNLLQYENV